MPPHPPAPRPPARAELLLSPLLLGSLAVLLLNDHVLKPAYGSWLTGKLSDFAGVLAFALFWRALLPARRGPACAAAGLAFVLWKSPAAEPLIGALNAAGLAAARVVDWTDLLALLVLPLAYAHVPPRRGPTRVHRALSSAAAAACVLAFAATSRLPPPPYLTDVRYDVPVPLDTLLVRLYDLRSEPYYDPGVPPALPEAGVDTLQIHFAETDTATDAGWHTATVEVSATGPRTSLLRLLSVGWDGRDSVAAMAVERAFQERVVGPLRQGAGAGRAHRRHAFAGPESRRLAPAILAPAALYEPRSRVDVSLAEPAYVALVEITPRAAWHVIYPADVDEARLPAGEHRLWTTCTAGAAAPVPPDAPVPACGVARRVAPADVARLQRRVEHPCPDFRPYPALAIQPGRLVLIAAREPLRRAELERAVAGHCGEAVMFPVEQEFLRRALAGMGVRHWAATEAVLRR